MQMTLWWSGVCLVCTFMWLFRYLRYCFPVLHTNVPTITYKRNFTLKWTCGGNPKGKNRREELIMTGGGGTNCVNLVLLLNCEPPL